MTQSSRPILIVIILGTDHHRHPDITIESSLEHSNFDEILTIPFKSLLDQTFDKNIILNDSSPKQVFSPNEDDDLRKLGDIAGVNIDNIPPRTFEQNEMMDQLILDLKSDSHLSSKLSCHDLPFEDPYILSSTMDHEHFFKDFFLPPSWAQYKRKDQDGFSFKMPLDPITFNCHTHQSHPMVYEKSLIFGNNDYSHPFDPGITLTSG